MLPHRLQNLTFFIRLKLISVKLNIVNHKIIFKHFTLDILRYNIITEIMQATTINNWKKSQGISTGKFKEYTFFI